MLDTYNANPSSMELSLKNFSEFKGSKTIIIGDMLELGEESQAEHQKILKFVRFVRKKNQALNCMLIFHFLASLLLKTAHKYN